MNWCAGKAYASYVNALRGRQRVQCVHESARHWGLGPRRASNREGTWGHACAHLALHIVPVPAAHVPVNGKAHMVGHVILAHVLQEFRHVLHKNMHVQKPLVKERWFPEQPSNPRQPFLFAKRIALPCTYNPLPMLLCVSGAPYLLRDFVHAQCSTTQAHLRASAGGKVWNVSMMQTGPPVLSSVPKASYS